MSDETLTRFEDLANELLFDIIDYLDISHIHKGFLGFNQRINKLLDSLDNISLVLSSTENGNDPAIECFRSKIAQLVVMDGRSCLTDFNRFSNVRSLKINAPLDSQLSQIHPDNFPHLNHLTLSAPQDSIHSLHRLYQDIFSGRFTLLKSCALPAGPMTYMDWSISTSLRFLILFSYPDFLHVETYRAILNSCPNLFHLRMFGRFNHSDLVQTNTFVHQLNYLSLITDERSINAVLDQLLIQVPNLQRLSLQSLPMAYAVLDINLVQLAATLHQRVPNLQRFTCHGFAIRKNTSDINTIRSLHPCFITINYYQYGHQISMLCQLKSKANEPYLNKIR